MTCITVAWVYAAKSDENVGECYGAWEVVILKLRCDFLQSCLSICYTSTRYRVLPCPRTAITGEAEALITFLPEVACNARFLVWLSKEKFLCSTLLLGYDDTCCRNHSLLPRRRPQVMQSHRRVIYSVSFLVVRCILHSFSYWYYEHNNLYGAVEFIW